MLWIKTFHLLFVMAWVAGIFYIPRIMVHYVEGRANGEDVSRLKIMVRKLFGFSSIMAVLATVLGFWLWLGWWLGSGDWVYAKIGLVFLLFAYHYQCFRYIVMMENDQLIRSSLYFRLYNEAPLVLLVPILILVVLKPF
ncbi:MAG: CopD family protein [Pseudomonadales bacterium]